LLLEDRHPVCRQKGQSMRIRTNLFVTLDGKVSGPDGRPVQPLLPRFTGADSYGLPDFLSGCEAVVMDRTTFLPALGAPRWPWRQPVFVLTSTALPDGTPGDVTRAAAAAELIGLMDAAGVSGDVHLVGGPSTVQAFRAIGALDEVWLHVVPLILGSGLPLAPAGTEPLPLALQSTRTFPDGVVELGFTLETSSTAPQA
jgi:dihydrofolate reductase